MHLVTKFSLQSFVQFDQRHERKNVNRDILTNVLHILEDGIPSIDRSFELKKKKEKGKASIRTVLEQWRGVAGSSRGEERMAANRSSRRREREIETRASNVHGFSSPDCVVDQRWNFSSPVFRAAKKEKKEEALDTSFTTSSSTDFVILPALDPPAIVG